MSDSWDDNEELCGEFCSESRDMLAEVEPVLVELESSAEAAGEVDPAEIDSIFRAFHSMKGSAGFLGLDTIVSVTHYAESLLDLFRQDPSLLRPQHVTVLCRTMDFVNLLLDQVESDYHDRGHEEPATEIEGQLTGLIETTRAGEEPSAASASTDAAEATTEPVAEVVDAAEETDEPTVEATPDPTPSATDEPGPSSDATASAEDTPPSGGREGKAAGGAAAAKSSKGTVRVDLERLDTLMDLVGELILAETMVTHNPDVAELSLPRFDKAAVHLNRITRSLQDVAMSTRMIPIGATFRKMLRVVRDLARKQSKEVELELVGEDTEIDKTVVEAIGDPLVHIVRNSVDHGIEAPRDRREAGKAPTGHVRLEARHQGGEIWILIEDDGKGLDREVILEKAISRGLIDPEMAGELRDSEIFRCIFEAGFSTAEQVTDVSGRGVGMDVVRRNIESLGGRVEIQSQLGRGTSITIRLPLTLAIIEGMLVRVGNLTYTLPLLSIRESIPIKEGDVTTVTDGGEMVRVRGGLIPMVRLHEYHDIEPGARNLEDGIAVVVEDVERFCLFVDEVIGQRQTVIKGLPEFLGSVKGVSGCSILSDGDISLILDVSSIESDRFTRGARVASDEKGPSA